MMRIYAIILLVFIGYPNVLNGQSSGFFDYIDYRITPLSSINSVESDISPLFVNGELFFSSVREEFFGDEKRQEQNTLFYDIYRAEIDEKGYPVTEREVVPGFGNMFHEGSAAWCKKTSELFVTISNEPEEARLSGNRNIQLRLVIMKELNGKWVVTREFPFHNPEFNFAHPAISITGDTLLFSSDMDGGYGNSDLYMSIREEGQWSKPVNMGEDINTAGNEMFPTFGPDGMLLFSSDALEPNYGQLDIYYTKFSNKFKPVNLGKEVNFSSDDFGLVIHSSGKYGYFSSNRYDWRKDDIYLVEFLPQVENIWGKVIARHNEKAVQEANVYLEDYEGNQIRSALTGHFGNFKFFTVPKGKLYQIYADKEGFASEKIPFSFLDDEFIELSLRRIIDYQIAVKDFENGNAVIGAEMICNGEKWKTDSEGIIKIEFDSIFNCLVRVSKPGYFDNAFELNPERFAFGSGITDTVWLFRKEVGKTFLMESIDFQIDKWKILPDSEPELNQLVKLMEDHPALRVEISAHTDSRGEDSYNLWLSQKRADSVLEYLVQKGIARERIDAIGYGETRLLNRCANGVICSEEEHLENRRTEFVILEY
ncbi:MAG: OmpA family protein [Bacteroidota bacterium]